VPKLCRSEPNIQPGATPFGFEPKTFSCDSGPAIRVCGRHLEGLQTGCRLIASCEAMPTARGPTLAQAEATGSVGAESKERGEQIDVGPQNSCTC